MSTRKYLSGKEVEVLLEELPSDIGTTHESSSDEELPVNKTAGPSSTQLCGADSDTSDTEQTQSASLRKWSKLSHSNTLPEFRKAIGPVVHHFAGKDSAADIFLTILPPNTIQHILFQTNMYIQQKQRHVKPVHLTEFYSFLGLQCYFGYHRLPQINHYWSSDKDMADSVAPKALRRDRYFEILSNLHVNDNASITATNSDKLIKIRPLLDDLNQSFQTLRHANRIQAIDESMVLFKGRSTLKQYNPMKPVKRGYKLWCRSDMSGYTYQFEVYQGKIKDAATTKEKYGLGGSVVDRLTSSLKGDNYIIMMDNFFSSVELFEHLKANAILACGTIRPNRRHLPKMREDKGLVRGDMDFCSTEEGISFFKWKDNRSVHLLSNYHGDEITTVPRKERDGTTREITAPMVVKDYNAFMGGVDKADMLRSLYDPDRKSKKWWHRLFFAVIEMAFVNAFVIYNDFHLDSEVSLLDFRRNLSMGLIALGSCPAKKGGRPATVAIPDKPQNKRRKSTFSVSKEVRMQSLGAHWPIFTTVRGRCEMCSIRCIQSRPFSKCTFCDVFLCVNDNKNCFTEYHAC